jgi:hypothetical protein
MVSNRRLFDSREILYEVISLGFVSLNLIMGYGLGEICLMFIAASIGIYVQSEFSIWTQLESRSKGQGGLVFNPKSTSGRNLSVIVTRSTGLEIHHNHPGICCGAHLHCLPLAPCLCSKANF